MFPQSHRHFHLELPRGSDSARPITINRPNFFPIMSLVTRSLRQQPQLCVVPRRRPLASGCVIFPQSQRHFQCCPCRPDSALLITVKRPKRMPGVIGIGLWGVMTPPPPVSAHGGSWLPRSRIHAPARPSTRPPHTASRSSASRRDPAPACGRRQCRALSPA